ncbi:MAG: Dam family site-specific DNA-(adenine-N6)-methyltransferase [Coriobacteriales bacterium]|jgi:DNA adenine methylase|nr:Dam family site-specific DNA-(adenine-N6)-methyltransferase [Coriobacteriales bacterium]
MVKYRGGKSRELAEMVPFIPKDYDRYIEPFFGGGAMYFHLMPERAVINDLNSKLMGFYCGVRNDFKSLSNELECLEAQYLSNRKVFDESKKKSPEKRVFDPNEELYYSIRDMFNGKKEPEYSDATIYYFINKTAYSGMIRYNSDGEYNVPYGRYKNFNTRLVTETHSALLKNAEITTDDYQNVFDLCTSSDFMFLDPPYDCVFSDYGNEETKLGFNEDEHRRLAKAFYALPCKALMVIGETTLTHGLYQDSIIHRYGKAYAVNIRNRFKSESNHILVANYEAVA